MVFPSESSQRMGPVIRWRPTMLARDGGIQRDPVRRSKCDSQLSDDKTHLERGLPSSIPNHGRWGLEFELPREHVWGRFL
jgi:hypothetical protein